MHSETPGITDGDLIELRNLIGQAHATLALMYGTQDTRRAMASLQRAQTIISNARRSAPPKPLGADEGEHTPRGQSVSSQSTRKEE